MAQQTKVEQARKQLVESAAQHLVMTVEPQYYSTAVGSVIEGTFRAEVEWVRTEVAPYHRVYIRLSEDKGLAKLEADVLHRTLQLLSWKASNAAEIAALTERVRASEAKQAQDLIDRLYN